MATLTTYRRTLAPLLGSYDLITAASSGSTTTAQLACTTLSANGVSLISTVLSASEYKDKWMYRPAASASYDVSRLIVLYTPGSGILKADATWTNAPTSEAVEILGLFPGTQLNLFVNEALKRCWLTVEFTFTTSSSQTRRHSLATDAAWLTDPRWVYQVGELASGESRSQIDPFRRMRRGLAHKDGNVVYIEGPSFPTSSTVYVKAIKPAYSHCAAAATPTTFTQSGLSAESDVATVDPEYVAWGAVIVAMDTLDSMERAGTATQEALQSRRMAAARFTHLMRTNFQEPERTFRRIENIQPTVGQRRW